MAIHKACLSTGNKHGQLATAGAGADATGSDSGSDSTQPSEPDVRKEIIHSVQGRCSVRRQICKEGNEIESGSLGANTH